MAVMSVETKEPLAPCLPAVRNPYLSALITRSTADALCAYCCMAASINGRSFVRASVVATGSSIYLQVKLMLNQFFERWDRFGRGVETLTVCQILPIQCAFRRYTFVHNQTLLCEDWINLQLQVNYQRQEWNAERYRTDSLKQHCRLRDAFFEAVGQCWLFATNDSRVLILGHRYTTCWSSKDAMQWLSIQCGRT